MEISDKIYIFVVDTDEYAGSFERDLCTYCTGIVPQYAADYFEDIAVQFKKEYPEWVDYFDKKIAEIVLEEEREAVPASIFPTPGYFNDGLGHVYKESEKGSDYIIENYNKIFNKLRPAIPNTGPGEYPAYNSVAIYFSDELSDEAKEFLIKRAKKFALKAKEISKYLDSINIINFRYLTRYTVTEELSMWRCNYDSDNTPPDYKCSICGRTGCKLWRDYNTFLNHQTFECSDCVLKSQNEKGPIREDGKCFSSFSKTWSDSIGSKIPAVPTEENDTYWGYTSVPPKGVDWWRRLPL